MAHGAGNGAWKLTGLRDRSWYKVGTKSAFAQYILKVLAISAISGKIPCLLLAHHLAPGLKHLLILVFISHRIYCLHKYPLKPGTILNTLKGFS